MIQCTSLRVIFSRISGVKLHVLPALKQFLLFDNAHSRERLRLSGSSLSGQSNFLAEILKRVS